MLKNLQHIEELVARIEGWLLTFLVVVMLALAVYNVFYRNALVPIQASIVAPDRGSSEPSAADAEKPRQPADANESEGDDSNGFGGGFEDSTDESGGFGGGFGDDDAPEDAETDDADGFGGGFGAKDASEAKLKPEQEAGGFAGGFGDDDAEPPTPAPKAEADGFAGGFGNSGDSDEADSEEAGGFGGGFGDAESGEESGGFAGGFGDGESDDFEPVEAPDPIAESSETGEMQLSGFEHFVVETVDALKIEWIDTLLRHLVLFVGFLGAMIATTRRKHITVDALSKVIPEKTLPYVDVVTSGLSMVICIFLAFSGWDLVKISLEFPKELMSWANEWTFQLVFPIGFALLAFHFGMRVIEALAEVFLGVERSPEGGEV